MLEAPVKQFSASRARILHKTAAEPSGFMAQRKAFSCQGLCAARNQLCCRPASVLVLRAV